MTSEWFLMEEVPRGTNMSLTSIYANFALNAKDFGFEKNFSKLVLVSQNHDCLLIVKKKDLDEAAEYILNCILADPGYAEELNNAVLENGKELRRVSRKVFETNESTLSDPELFALFDELMNVYRLAHLSGLFAYIVDYNELFSNYLQEYLKTKCKSDLEVNEVFAVLTTPTVLTPIKLEEKNLLEIALLASKDEKTLVLFKEKLAGEIEAHYQEFCWIPYMYVGPAWSKTHFIESLSVLLNQKIAFQEKINAIDEMPSLTRETQEKLLIELGVDEKHALLISIARDMVFYKGYRKDGLYLALYRGERLFKEIAKRLNITLDEFRAFLCWEVGPALLNSVFSVNDLRERLKYHVFAISSPGGHEFLYGEEAKTFVTNLNLPIACTEITELKGTCACPGFARGAVRIINSPEEMTKMQNGDVLVAHNTNPDIVVAMKKASAIITDLGGVTCHAAIVSRELKIPCVIGTKIATKWLKDGDLVEVDANKGRVKKT
ncbi:MAG: PEP-utilizing enzyme [Candidatus Micrarchaeota archaeon]